MARRKQRSTTIKYLTEKEIEVLFSVIASRRDLAMFRIAYHRGLRASEVGMLQLADYRRDCGRLYVKRLKGSDAAEFKLTRIEETSLRAWIRERGPAPGPLFPSRQGGGVSRFLLDKLTKRYAKRAGIPRDRAHFHCLKHSCGTHLLTMGEDLIVVKDHLGHRDIKSTMIYAQFTTKAREASAERLRDWGR